MVSLSPARGALVGLTVFVGAAACGTGDAALVALPFENAATDDATDSNPGVFERFDSAATCGECHPTHYAEWRESMHAYAAHSPVFDAMALRAYRDSAGEIGTFCTGCHTPLGTLDGEPGTTTAEVRSERSLESVTCTVCHQAVDHTGIVGNTGLILDPEAPIQAPHSDADSMDHESVQSAQLVDPTLCGSCHDVFKFPGLLVEQAFTEYQTSPSAAAGNTCQDCHMSPDPGLPTERPLEPVAVGGDYPARHRSSHRFVGPDSSLLDDWPYGPERAADNAEARAAGIERTLGLLQNAVRLDEPAVAERGGELTVSVVVESTTDGHRVPTGFTSERQLWLSVTATTPGGTVCWQTGDLDANGDLRDEHSEEVRGGRVDLDLDLVNFQSINHTLVREYRPDGAFEPDTEPVQSTTMFPFEAQYVERRSLEPRERRAVTWTVPCPPDVAVTVELKYRNLPPHLLRALGVGELVEKLPVYTLSSWTVGG